MTTNNKAPMGRMLSKKALDEEPRIVGTTPMWMSSRAINIVRIGVAIR